MSNCYTPPSRDLYQHCSMTPIQQTSQPWIGPAGSRAASSQPGHTIAAPTYLEGLNDHMTNRALDAWRVTRVPAPNGGTRRGNCGTYNLNYQGRMGGVGRTVFGRSNGGGLSSGLVADAFSERRFTDYSDLRGQLDRNSPAAYTARPPAPTVSHAMQMGDHEAFATPCRRLAPDIEIELDHSNLIQYHLNPYTQPLPRIDGSGWGYQ